MEFWSHERPHKENMMQYVDLLIKNTEGVRKKGTNLFID